MTDSALHVVVVIGGDALSSAVVASLPPEALCVAADSGLDHAIVAGLTPSILVGDCDSISAAGLQWATDHDVEILAFPPDKDFTDTELALQAALEHGATTITMVSGGGDRLDHTLGAITALGHASLAQCQPGAYWGTSFVRVLHGPTTELFTGHPNATFSLLALHGQVDGVTLVGARYPLNDASLFPGSSRGVSNQTQAEELSITVAAGVLTIVFPNNGVSL
jgi:thiamine pyrophosphokinase